MGDTEPERRGNADPNLFSKGGAGWKMSKRKERKFHARQTIYTITGIILVIVLFGAAMIFPTYYSRLYDQNKLNRVFFTDVNVSTYETSYNSFAEKLHAIARAWSGGGELRAVRTNELEETADRAELTRTVNKEFQRLFDLTVLNKKIKPKEKRLTQCERYTVYETKETGGMKGISLWKMVYENSKRKITVLLDEEYHKIYYMEIYYHHPESVKDNIIGQIYDYDKASDASTAVGQVGQYGRVIDYCWPLFMEYYNIDSYKEGNFNGWINEEGDTGIMEFDEQYQITFVGILDIGEDFQRYRIGIPLEKMIQI